MKWTLISQFYRGLTLSHLERSLYSISRQESQPDELLFYDNNTVFDESDIKKTIATHFDIGKWKLHFRKGLDPRKATPSVSTNEAIRLAQNDIFILCKADTIFSFDCCKKLLAAHGGDLNTFSTSWMFQMNYLSGKDHLTVDHAADLEPLNWREDPKRLLQNNKGANEHKFVENDAGCYCTTKQVMDKAGWYDEYLTLWGFWQQALHQDMHKAAVNIVVIPEFLYFHMLHPVEGGEHVADEKIKDPVGGRLFQAEAAFEEWKRSPKRIIQDRKLRAKMERMEMRDRG